jgi:hypothetical protein
MSTYNFHDKYEPQSNTYFSVSFFRAKCEVFAFSLTFDCVSGRPEGQYEVGICGMICLKKTSPITDDAAATRPLPPLAARQDRERRTPWAATVMPTCIPRLLTSCGPRQASQAPESLENLGFHSPNR